MDEFRERLSALREDGQRVVDMLRVHRSSVEALLELGMEEARDILRRINGEIEHFLVLPYVEAAREFREEEFEFRPAEAVEPAKVQLPDDEGFRTVETREGPMTIQLPDEWEPIPDDAYLYTKEDFIRMCRGGDIIDDDGTGCYALADGMTHIAVSPSAIAGGLWEEPWTHVAWFNK